MCNSCHASVVSTARLPTIDRKDLADYSGIEEELDNDDNQVYPTFKEL